MAENESSSGVGVSYIEVDRELGLGQILKFGNFQIVVQLFLVLISL